MVSNFHLPPSGFGPGSQPVEDAALEYLEMPSDMRTYSTHLPEIATGADLAPALALLDEIAGACARAAGGAVARFDLAGLDAANRALIAETMGQGEVAMTIRGVPALMVQESVFAGVWMVAGADRDTIEVGPVPEAARARAFVAQRAARGAGHPRSTGVVNAPSLAAEIEDRSARFDGAMHAINLTLLPHTEEDLVWLDAAVGAGSVTILSRGYGNCRVTATALDHVWRVQFFNSMDKLILDSFEVTAIPEVAVAAPEDLADSAGRIREVLEAIR